MPNHVTNRLRASGPSDDVHSLAQLLRGNDQPVDFNQVLKMPDEMNISPPQCNGIEFYTLAGDTSGAEECLQKQADKPLSTETSEGFRRLQEQKQGDIPKHLQNLSTYGYVSWYDWRIAHWGTKWNAYDCSEPVLAEEQDGTAVFEVIFDTAWSPPFPIIEMLADQFPQLTLTFKFFDEQWNFAGQQSCINSDLDDEIEINMDDEESAKSFAREVYGEDRGWDED